MILFSFKRRNYFQISHHSMSHDKNIITKMDHIFEKISFEQNILFFREIGFFKIRRMKREFSGTTTGRLRTNSLRISQYINISIYMGVLYCIIYWVWFRKKMNYFFRCKISWNHLILFLQLFNFQRFML